MSLNDGCHLFLLLPPRWVPLKSKTGAKTGATHSRRVVPGVPRASACRGHPPSARRGVLCGTIFDAMATATAKQEAQKVLDTLPDDASLEDIQYHLYVLQKIEQGRRAIEEGDVLSHEEVKRRMAKWLGK